MTTAIKFPRILSAALLLLVLFSFKGKKLPKILVYTKTNGFHHNSIPAGVKAIEKLGAENGFVVDVTTDSLQFTAKNLKKYKAVVFLNTTGNILDDAEQKVFTDYIHAGHGYVGVHAAADTEYDWPWYNELVGAWFKSHPKQAQAKLQVLDKDFIATKGLPADWSKWDEWYNYKNTHWDEVHVLVNLDEKSYTGGENGDQHPISWYHDFEGGRSFYTGMGHTDESYTDASYLTHLLGGIKYAIGK